jgi:hypothetical protein
MIRPKDPGTLKKNNNGIIKAIEKKEEIAAPRIVDDRREHNMILSQGTTFPLGHKLLRLSRYADENRVRLVFEKMKDSKNALDIYFPDAEQAKEFEKKMICWSCRENIRNVAYISEPYEMLDTQQTEPCKVVVDLWMTVESKVVQWVFEYKSEFLGMQMFEQMKSWRNMIVKTGLELRLTIPLEGTTSPYCATIAGHNNCFYEMFALDSTKFVLVSNAKDDSLMHTYLANF